jgi:hypothetical protein
MFNNFKNRLFYLFKINRCGKCFSKNLNYEVTDKIDYTVCEERHYCKNCNFTVNYWAYGHWEIPEPEGEGFFERFKTLIELIYIGRI